MFTKQKLSTSYVSGTMLAAGRPWQEKQTPFLLQGNLHPWLSDSFWDDFGSSVRQAAGGAEVEPAFSVSPGPAEGLAHSRCSASIC